MVVIFLKIKPKDASVIKLSDRYYFVESGVNLYILDLKSNKKIVVKDWPLCIEENDENLLLLRNVNQPYHLRYRSTFQELTINIFLSS